MREGLGLFTFNRGIVSRYGLGRVDVKRMALSAQIQNNWTPRILGSMSIREGLGFFGSIYNNAACKFIEFIFATTDTAILEIQGAAKIMRVWVNDVLVNYAAVGTAITNGTFATNLTGWTVNDEAGATTSWTSGGGFQMVSNASAAALLDQALTIAAGDQGKEHCIHVVVTNGPITIRIGTSTTDDSYLNETLLNTGNHYLSFTPTGTPANIRFRSVQITACSVASCVMFNGELHVPTPWALSDLNSLRWDQSADVIFVACAGYQQRQIERRGTRSWSVVLYLPPDGPFMVENVTPTTIAVSGISGTQTLTASRPIFYASGGFGTGKQGHIGALFRVASLGQFVTASIGAQNVFSDPIEITGVGVGRDFTLTVTGSSGNSTQWTLQYSVGVPGIWQDVTNMQVIYPTSPRTLYTVTSFVGRSNDNWPESAVPGCSLNDANDNATIYYRVGVKTGGYVSGTLVVTLNTTGGSLNGIGRITAVNSSTSATIEVLQNFGGTAAVTTWWEGSWSDWRGWPTSVRLYEGRLWWAGKNGVLGSVSDGYNSFDDTIVGDAGPINRTIGSGPVDVVNWMIPLLRLLLGAQGNEQSIRSDALDGILTPTNFNIKKISGQGSANLPALTIDQMGYFVNRTGYRVYSLSFEFKFYDYAPRDETAICPDLLKPGVIRIAYQRQPDTRIHYVRSDGVVVMQVLEVSGFVTVTTNGIIEDVVVLPALSGNQDDQVYYVVNRTINGATVRNLEKFAQHDQCKGDQPLCLLGDAYIAQTFGSPQTVITGLASLNTCQVVVWADGADVGTQVNSDGSRTLLYAVAGGQITLPVAATNVMVGLPYTAQFQSTKLGLATSQIQSPLNRKGKVQQIGLLMADVYKKAIRYGSDFLHLYDMPEIEGGTVAPAGTSSAYDEPMFNFGGTWTTDARVCLQAQAPQPVTVLALAIDMEKNA
jgi:hypothetical protein